MNKRQRKKLKKKHAKRLFLIAEVFGVWTLEMMKKESELWDKIPVKKINKDFECAWSKGFGVGVLRP